MQFIRYQAVSLPSVPVFDIGAEREAAARAAGGHETVRLAQQGGKLLFAAAVLQASRARYAKRRWT